MTLINEDVAGERAHRVLEELGTVVLGQEDMLRQMMVALLAGGHALLEGVPGTAKTLSIRSLAMALELRFGRVQFTPDLMPTDLIGVNVLDELQPRVQLPPRARSSRTCCWRTRSTAPRPRPRRRCWRPCRSGR